MPMLVFCELRSYYGDASSVQAGEFGVHACRQIRRPKDGSVKYCVGDVMVHRQYGYQGFIYGWDATCSAGDDWIAQMNVDALSG